MTLWLLLAAITALALVLMLRPILWGRRGVTSRETLETAIYRDRLTEVKRDLERGLLSPAEAEAAEAEISRRMLKVAEARHSAAMEAPATRSRWVAAALVTAVLPLGTVILYLMLGAPDQPNHPFQARQAEPEAATQHSGIDMGEAIERLAERLEQNPEDLEGWILLGRSYASEGRYAEAAEAFRRAVELSGNQPELLGAYGETLVAAAEGIVTPEARRVFEEMTAAEPGNPGPKFYLGLARAQAGDGRGALEIWLGIEAEAPPDVSWLPALRENIERTAAQFGIDPASITPRRSVVAAPPGPSAEDVAAARAMSEQERDEMIRGMVDRLAARLEQEPDDVEGWLRLTQAYRILGERENAERALRRAAANNTTSPDLRRQIDQMASELGVVLEPDQNTEGDAPATPPSGAAGQ